MLGDMVVEYLTQLSKPPVYERASAGNNVPVRTLSAGGGDGREHDAGTTARSRARRPGKAALASWIGSVLEYYDFFIYGTAAALVFGKVFFPDSDPATATLLSFATYGVGYVARPIGAFFMGHIGDRYGRKRVLLLTVVADGHRDVPRRLPAQLRRHRPVGADAARHAAAAAGLLRLGRAVGRQLAQPRARARAPARVLHQLHAERHPDRPHHRDGRLPADRRDAGGPAAELGLAHPVLAERDRGRRRRADPAPDRGAAGVPPGGVEPRPRASRPPTSSASTGPACCASRWPRSPPP